MSEPLRRRASLPFTASLIKASAPDEAAVASSTQLAGHTRDMRATGLSLVLSGEDALEESLRAADVTLRITLELPVGPIELYAAPVRSEWLEETEDERGLLVGVRITEIGERDCLHFVRYLRTLR